MLRELYVAAFQENYDHRLTHLFQNEAKDDTTEGKKDMNIWKKPFFHIFMEKHVTSIKWEPVPCYNKLLS